MLKLGLKSNKKNKKPKHGKCYKKIPRTMPELT